MSTIIYPPGVPIVLSGPTRLADDRIHLSRCAVLDRDPRKNGAWVFLNTKVELADVLDRLANNEKIVEVANTLEDVPEACIEEVLSQMGEDIRAFNPEALGVKRQMEKQKREEEKKLISEVGRQRARVRRHRLTRGAMVMLPGSRERYRTEAEVIDMAQCTEVERDETLAGALVFRGTEAILSDVLWCISGDANIEKVAEVYEDEINRETISTVLRYISDGARALTE